MYKIAAPSFCNIEPLLFPLKDLFILHRDEPSRISTAFDNNECDILISSATRIMDKENLLSYGIAAEKEVMSVALFCPTSFQSVKLAATSSSSNTLLKVIAKHFWKKELSFSYEKGDAFLLFGDECLRFHSDTYQKIDLATVWYEETGLPFVFARGYIHNPHIKPCIEEHFQKALQWSSANKSVLLSEISKKTGFSKELLSCYYDTLSFKLEKKHLESIELFHKLVKDIDV